MDQIFHEIKINTNGTFLSEKICHSIFKNEVAQIIISADHYIKKGKLLIELTMIHNKSFSS